MSYRIFLRVPQISDCDEFLKIPKSNLAPFIYPPSNKKEYLKYVESITEKENKVGLFLCLKKTNQIIGIINFNEIVRGALQSAYLGYYLFKDYEGKGYMFEGLKCAIVHGFKIINLHRLEANIQPNNLRSIKLVKSLGFKKEGFSPRYLKIKGRWRDHERWAILKE
jgi:ribosomal-protein-alanine N-acetyltransferase